MIRNKVLQQRRLDQVSLCSTDSVQTPAVVACSQGQPGAWLYQLTWPSSVAQESAPPGLAAACGAAAGDAALHWGTRLSVGAGEHLLASPPRWALQQPGSLPGGCLQGRSPPRQPDRQ